MVLQTEAPAGKKNTGLLHRAICEARNETKIFESSDYLKQAKVFGAVADIVSRSQHDDTVGCLWRGAA